MKDKLLYGTIGLLAGVVVMQWTMPSGQATIVTAPVGVVVAATESAVLAADGSIWGFYNDWTTAGSIPIPVEDVQFFTHGPNGYYLIDKNGNQWWRHLDGQWTNNGQPPVGTVATDQSTWGNVKAGFREK